MPKDANFGLRDEIKAYWSARAETFDLQIGHEIFCDAERSAWHDLIRRHLEDGNGRRALDLGCGTGVISRLMEEMGYDVTGMDWAEPMLARARSKAGARGSVTRFLEGDAERTMEPSGAYDVLVTRHLVWTLVDPEAAFAEWRRVLKPGGELLLIDGDFVSPTWITWFRKVLRSIIPGEMELADPRLTKTHSDILSRVHFSGGARADAVADMLVAAGFGIRSIDTDLRSVHRTQGRRLKLGKRLERGSRHRYAIHAVRSERA